MHKKPLSTQLHPSEVTWGIRYLLFELVFLGTLLSIIVPLLWRNVNSAQMTAIYYFINFAAVLWIFRRFLISSLGQGLRHWVRSLLIAVIALAVYLLLFQLLNQLLPEYCNPNDTRVQENFKDNRLLTAVGAIVLVPLAEETLFRGLLFGLFHQKSRILAYVISTIAFSLIHVGGYVQSSPPLFLLLSVVQYIPAGLALAWAYECSGSIAAPILMHTVVNTIATFDMR